MRYLIAYAGRSGTTQKAAHLLGEYFEDVDIKDLTRDYPNPSKYDAVIVGSSIRRGRIENAARKFLIKHENVLSDKKLGLYICNVFLDQVPVIFEKNFPKQLLAECVCVDSFGGEVNYENLGLFERMAADFFLKNLKEQESVVLPCLMTDRIRIFSENMKNA